jgi:hypothetical protein
MAKRSRGGLATPRRRRTTADGVARERKIGSDNGHLHVLAAGGKGSAKSKHLPMTISCHGSCLVDEVGAVKHKMMAPVRSPVRGRSGKFAIVLRSKGEGV